MTLFLILPVLSRPASALEGRGSCLENFSFVMVVVIRIVEYAPEDDYRSIGGNKSVLCPTGGGVRFTSMRLIVQVSSKYIS